jgi:hypothetical protein
VIFMPTNAINDTGVKYIYDKLDAKKVEKETGKGLSTNDYDNTDKAKVDMIDNTTTSASSNPISIADLKSAQIALNSVITFEPIQAGSGTPSPSNIRAISGYDKIEVLSCQKNLFDKDKVELGGIDQTTGENMPSTSIYRTKVYINVKSGGTYYISGLENTAIRVFRYIGNTFLTSGVYYTDFAVTFDDETTRIRMQGASLNDKKGTIQIELGSTPTTYSPYHKTTDLSESLGQTVYGLTDDVRSGLCTDIWTKIDLSTLNWGYS